MNQVGIRERSGKNDGEVQKYNAVVGIPLNSPYCTSGPYWTFYVACDSVGLPKSAIPLPKTGLAWAVYQYGVQHGIKTTLQPQPSDFLTWRFSNKIQGHEAQVYKVEQAGWLVCISYNSPGKIGDEREGDGVWLKRYNYKHPLGRMKFRGFTGFLPIDCVRK